MRIEEILVKVLMKTSIFEMAYDRQKAIDIVSDLSPEIFDHLLKLWVLEYPQGKNHWISEINAWLRKINRIRLKSSKKKPSKQDLYDWMVFEASPHYDEDYVNEMILLWKNEDYIGVPVRDFDVDIILNQIFHVIELICTDISAGNFVTVNNYI